MSTVASPLFSDAVVVMGVAGCGKTTIGLALAKLLAVPFTEGDALHSVESVEKMSAGIALTDDDRWPWLARIGAVLRQPEGRVVSCSALKAKYRAVITSTAGKPVRFVHLHGDRAVLMERMSSRKGHFMPAALLDSQLQTLEMPNLREDAITIDIAQPVDAIVKTACAFLWENGALT
jgi:gluconokinase